MFEWTRWREVLSELGLKPLEVGIPPTQEELKNQEASYQGRGESEDHRGLKDYVASNAVKLGLNTAGVRPVKEYITLSGDRLDVFFESPET